MSLCLFIHSSVFQFHDRAKEAKQHLQMRSWKLATKISVLQRKSPACTRSPNSTKICNRHRYCLTGNQKKPDEGLRLGKKKKKGEAKTTTKNNKPPQIRTNHTPIFLVQTFAAKETQNMAYLHITHLGIQSGWSSGALSFAA